MICSRIVTVAAFACLVTSAGASADTASDCAKLSGDAALAACTEYLKAHPGDPKALYWRGIEYGEKGQHEKAIADYTEAISHDSASVEPLLSRAFSRNELGDKEGAVADLKKILALDPGNNSAKMFLERLGVAK